MLTNIVGCQCIQHNNYEQQKLEKTKPISCCKQETLVTPYTGVLRSVDCPAHVLHNQLVNHNQHIVQKVSHIEACQK